MLAVIDNKSAHINLRVIIKPFLGKRNDEHGEERSSQVRVKDGPDADDSRIRATPWSESGISDVPNRGTGDNHEEVVTELCVTRLEVALNVPMNTDVTAENKPTRVPRSVKRTLRPG